MRRRLPVRKAGILEPGVLGIRTLLSRREPHARSNGQRARHASLRLGVVLYSYPPSLIHHDNLIINRKKSATIQANG